MTELNISEMGNTSQQIEQIVRLLIAFWRHAQGGLLAVGSSSAIFACSAARSRMRVAFIDVCGDDVFGRFMLDELQRREVDVSHVIVHPARQTGLSVILDGGAGRIKQKTPFGSFLVPPRGFEPRS